MADHHFQGVFLYEEDTACGGNIASKASLFSNHLAACLSLPAYCCDWNTGSLQINIKEEQRTGQ